MVAAPPRISLRNDGGVSGGGSTRPRHFSRHRQAPPSIFRAEHFRRDELALGNDASSARWLATLAAVGGMVGRDREATGSKGPSPHHFTRRLCVGARLGPISDICRQVVGDMPVVTSAQAGVAVEATSNTPKIEGPPEPVRFAVDFSNLPRLGRWSLSKYITFEGFVPRVDPGFSPSRMPEAGVHDGRDLRELFEGHLHRAGECR
jgi:hypothetical protein